MIFSSGLKVFLLEVASLRWSGRLSVSTMETKAAFHRPLARRSWGRFPAADYGQSRTVPGFLEERRLTVHSRAAWSKDKALYFMRGHMRFMLAIVCLFACVTSSQAQSGVSNVRDGNGNIVRDTGMNPARSQGSANNPNESTMNVAAPTANNSRPNKKTNK
jgi:hypothetical protein